MEKKKWASLHRMKIQEYWLQVSLTLFFLHESIDSPETIQRVIKKAKSDSLPTIRYHSIGL